MIEKVKQELEQKLTTLQNRVEKLESHRRLRTDDDFSEAANEKSNDEVRDRLEESEIEEIKLIQTALERINDGSYGLCKKCENKIQEKRLAALPYAITCIECASDE